MQRDAVLRFAQTQARYPALVEILERRPPRARLDGTLEDAALSLDGSYLFVQGPPGSGKTWNGARMAIALMRAGRRVGVTALSHKAIHKFLEDVEDAAREQGYTFRGPEEVGGRGHALRGRFVESTGDNAAMLDQELQLLAGTSFLFAREELDRHVDTLFIDEGGQFALADALAVGTAARNLVLLGDPNQLPQVSQGAHPPGANASVLGHLLGDGRDRPDGMGLFLEQTWRMRPEVNAFISETFYEGRLEPAPVTSSASLADGNGIRFLPVEHEGTAAVAGGGRGRRGRDRRGCSARRTPTRRRARRSRRGRHRRRAVQRARPLPAPEDPGPADPDRHRRQVPGPAGAGRLLLDGELERRGRPARPRVPVLAEPAQRRDLAREVPGVPRREPAPGVNRSLSNAPTPLPLRAGTGSAHPWTV